MTAPIKSTLRSSLWRLHQMAPLRVASPSGLGPPWMWRLVQPTRVAFGVVQAATQTDSARRESALAEKTVRVRLRQDQRSRSSHSMGASPKLHCRAFIQQECAFSYDNLDFFNPSTVDGFNIPLTITPGAGCGHFSPHIAVDRTTDGSMRW